MPRRNVLDEIADELYSCPSTEFTAARNTKAREALGAGNVELADALRRLHKPTVAAWLANLLVRKRPQEVANLVALGAALRRAQAAFDGEALRRLSEQRHKVVGGLSRDARHLADERGQIVSDAVVRQLEGTLEAALFDPGAAEQLRRGRLTGALAYSGIGFPPAPSFPSSVASPRSSTASTSQSPVAVTRGSAKRKPARGSPSRTGVKELTPGSALRRAQRDARDARRAAERAATVLASAERASERKRTAVSATEAELARRRQAARAALQAVAQARAVRDAAEREARRTEQRVEAVRRGRSAARRDGKRP